MKTPILTGTTASGKTAIALKLARERGDIEIINADSMLVYRGLDIGTAKPTREELAEIPHHLVDIRNPNDPYNAGDFFRDATRAIREIRSRGKRPLVVGGTGFYLKALLFGMWETSPVPPHIRSELEKQSSERLFELLNKADPESATLIGKGDRYRLIRAHEILQTTGRLPSELRQKERPVPSADFELFWVDRDTRELHERIHQRTSEMLRKGLVEEVQRIQEQTPHARCLDAVGYAQVRDFLAGTPPSGRKIRPGMAGLQDEIELATRQLVKRQRTWFRGQTGIPPSVLDQDLPRLLEALNRLL